MAVSAANAWAEDIDRRSRPPTGPLDEPTPATGRAGPIADLVGPGVGPGGPGVAAGRGSDEVSVLSGPGPAPCACARPPAPSAAEAERSYGPAEPWSWPSGPAGGTGPDRAAPASRTRPGGRRDNPLRAGLVDRAEEWRWSSLRWLASPERAPVRLEPGTVPRGSLWVEGVNAASADVELETVRESVRWDRPFGTSAWARETARRWAWSTACGRRVGRERSKRRREKGPQITQSASRSRDVPVSPV